MKGGSDDQSLPLHQWLLHFPSRSLTRFDEPVKSKIGVISRWRAVFCESTLFADERPVFSNSTQLKAIKI